MTCSLTDMQSSPWLCHVCDYSSGESEPEICALCYRTTCDRHLRSASVLDTSTGLYVPEKVCIICGSNSRL